MERAAGFAVLVALACFAGCSRRPEASVSAGTDNIPAPVRIARAEQKSFPIQVRGSGHVEPSATVTIRSEVDGVLQDVYFTEGETVREGQLLFRIDARAHQESIRRLEANLAKSAAQARNAQNEAARYAELLKLGLIARQQYEQAEGAAIGWQATLESDRAAVENARRQLTRAEIHSPLGGRTGALMASEGSLLIANTTALVTVHQIEPVLVSFSVSEKDLPEIRARFGSGLHVDATPSGDRAATGKLTFIDNSVDSARGTIRMKAMFSNSDQRLWPGQFVDVVVTVAEQTDAIVVPSEAIQNDQEGPHVLVVTSESKAERRTVEVIRKAGNYASVVGLLPGEPVVVESSSGPAPGSKVEVLNR